uniref:NADH-ubiquinone oxidoreductase chain 2 n=1 Tax=Fieberiella septentrionalis TaxID=1978376 RepID=A0A890CB56_9HEMI|nr:NADH dehydrogenase subunit 2 [Fieberiella septentrionalis]QRG29276.1 NADH dehydrogenase subunit 2 [Fieberiella septentrionalis]
MFLNLTNLLFTNVTMIGVMVTICSNNWISMWMGMEMSLLAIIPLMLTKKKTSSESSMKYFITQSVASTILLLSIMIMLIGVNMNCEIYMAISMAIKIGVAPFHNWMMIMIEGLEYELIILILTLMKIPPLNILSYLNINLNSIIILSMIVGAIMSLNQSSVRKIMGYSSIFNMGMMLSMINNKTMMSLFMMIYMMLTLMFIKPINELKINFINQFNLNEKNSNMKLNLWILILSMGGFPPLMGFFNKYMVIQNLIFNKQLLLTVIMIMMSLIVMFFYMRMTFNLITINSIQKKWKLNLTMKSYYSIIAMNFFMSPILMTLKTFM